MGVCALLSVAMLNVAMVTHAGFTMCVVVTGVLSMFQGWEGGSPLVSVGDRKF